MKYLRYAVVVLAVVALIASVACKKTESSPTSSAAPAAAATTAKGGEKTDEGLPHPCTLVTTADAEAILGPGATVVRDSVTTCDLQAKNIFDGGLMSIKMEPASEDWAGTKEMTMKFDDKAKSVSGIGDDAYSFMGGMIIKKGNMEINVIATAYKSKVMPKEKAVEYVAKKVIAQL